MAHSRSIPRWPEVAPPVGDPALNTGQAAFIRTVLEDCGSRAFVERLASDYLGTALRVDKQAGLQPELLAELASLTDRIARSAA